MQEAVRVIFARFRQQGRACQVLLLLAAEQTHFPGPSDGKKLELRLDADSLSQRHLNFEKPVLYAGAYAYGKSQNRTALFEGRVRTTNKHRKPFDQWNVIIKKHYEGFIEWSEFERNQKLLAANA